jgi:hypothetical protein
VHRFARHKGKSQRIESEMQAPILCPSVAARRPAVTSPHSILQPLSIPPRALHPTGQRPWQRPVADSQPAC